VGEFEVAIRGQTLLGQLFSIGKDSCTVNPPMDAYFADREDHMQMLSMFQEIGDAIRRNPFSLFVHSEGTRSEFVRKTGKVSGVLIELAMACNLPIIPVRFFGGLPLVGTVKLEFPYRYGQQDIYLGKAIEPEELRQMPYGERTGFVLDAMNCVGSAVELERPLPYPQQFHGMPCVTGTDKFSEVILKVLEAYPESCAETKALLEYRLDKHNKLNILFHGS